MNTAPYSIALPGLDGSNPLAFLAALGVLRCIDVAHEGACPRLAWDASDLRPVLVTARPMTMGQVAEGAAHVLKQLFQSQFSGSAYPSAWLGVPLKTYRQMAANVPAGGVTALDRLYAGLLAAATCEAVSAHDNTEVSEMSFANGQSSLYLLGGNRANKKGKISSFKGLRDIVANKDLTDLIHDAVGRWTTRPGFPSFRWSPAEFRPAAYQGDQTSIDSVPGANALAFVGLSFFPTVPTSRGVRTVGLNGNGRRRDLVYPLWRPPLDCDGVATAVTHAVQWIGVADPERNAAGIIVLLGSRRFEHEKGIYFGQAEGR